MEFSLTVTLEPPTARIVAAGELDIFGAREVAERLWAAVRSGCPAVEVDVSGVTFVDVSALGVLDRTRAAVVAERGTMGVVAPPAVFRRACDLAGLGPSFGLN